MGGLFVTALALVVVDTQIDDTQARLALAFLTVVSVAFSGYRVHVRRRGGFWVRPADWAGALLDLWAFGNTPSTPEWIAEHVDRMGAAFVVIVTAVPWCILTFSPSSCGGFGQQSSAFRSSGSASAHTPGSSFPTEPVRTDRIQRDRLNCGSRLHTFIFALHYCVLRAATKTLHIVMVPQNVPAKSPADTSSAGQ